MAAPKFTIRPFSPEEDIPRLLRLRAEAEAVDQEGSETNEEALRAQLELPGHDPLQDRWVIDSPKDWQQIVGYGLVWVAPGAESAEINILVHPDWRRQGLGQALLSRIQERAEALGAALLHTFAHEKNPAAGPFLREHTFQSEGAYTELRIPADVHLPMPIWPYGYQLRTYAEVQDLSLLTQAMNYCYEGLWGHHEVSEAQMAEWLPGFNPESLFLVFSARGRLVGISRVEVSAERTARNGLPTGYIDAPGIVPPHRRDDLFRAMAITGIRWLHGQNQALVEMESWGDRPTTLRVYHELGFQTLKRLISYKKPLQKPSLQGPL
jgi:mycothiol synthase